MKSCHSSLLGPVVAAALAVSPFYAQAQEYLPPVIDRSTASASSSSAVASQSAALGSVEERLERLERKVDNKALVDMLMRLDSLQTELQFLQGEQESMAHAIEGIKQRQRDLYLDIDRRLQQLESSVTQLQNAAPAVPATTGSGAVLAVPGVAVPAVDASLQVATQTTVPATMAEPDPVAERLAYEKAFKSLKEGQYDQAISEFQAFLSLYSQGDYADNAQYWLGEANYVTRRFKQAEQEFLKVLSLYPDSSKVADAKLKLGYTYYELSEWDKARQVLNEVIAAKPGSTVARLAENRLQKMRLEGR